MAPQDIAIRLASEKKYNIQRSLAEACYWNRGVERNQRKPSDQLWIEIFSNGKASEPSAREFFSTYQIHRAKWRFEIVAKEINRLSSLSDWVPSSGVAGLSKTLAQAISDVQSVRISAASKVAMFTRPRDDVFIWDSLAVTAMGIRSANREEANRMVSYSTKGQRGYVEFHRDCKLELNAERESLAFQKAVEDFLDYIEFTRGDWSTLADRSYFERRLFDKLLVCEGIRIEELLAAAKEPKASAEAKLNFAV